MLADFIARNRAEIIVRAQHRLHSRSTPAPTQAEIKDGIPVFLDELSNALKLAEANGAADHRQITASAERHGRELQRIGLTVGQVVHDYGDVCQAITELAVQRDASIPPGEFQTLNLCLDDAIAGAVSEYSRNRESAMDGRSAERLGMLAHELRNLLNSAVLSFEAIRTGRVTANGSTGAVHSRSLMGLRALIDRSLAEVRLETGIMLRERINVSEFVEEIEIGALLQSRQYGHRFVATCPDDRTVSIEGDRQVLAGALGNLIQNAFKFTPPTGRVALTVRAEGQTVYFAVEDQCGGLLPGNLEDLFLPFEQRNTDRSGLGLGLAISRKAAQVHGGDITIQNLPGTGCVFTLCLPQAPPS